MSQGKIRIVIEKDDGNEEVFYANTQEEVIDRLISYIAMVNSDQVNLIYEGSGNIPRWMRFYPQD